MKIRYPVAVLTAAAASTAAVEALTPRMRSWGSTEAEREGVFAGDELSPNAAAVHTRAVHIDAPVDAVWPWLLQIGQDRSGFYSYTSVENLSGCHMPRVHEIHDDWQHRAPGDVVLMAAPKRNVDAFNVVHEVRPNSALVMVGPSDPERIQRGAEATWVWSFNLVPDSDGTGCRLVVRSRYMRRLRWLEPIHFTMERRMMLTIAELATTSTSTGPPAAAATDKVAV